MKEFTAFKEIFFKNVILNKDSKMKSNSSILVTSFSE